MNAEYEALRDDLMKTDIPFAEYGWNTRPDADCYGVISLEFEADSLEGDNVKKDRAWEGSLDLFIRLLSSRDTYIAIVEPLLEKHCDGSWRLNQIQHERDTGMLHFEWVFQVGEG